MELSIAGEPAQVLFSGLAPGFASLYQINAVLPSGLDTGEYIGKLLVNGSVVDTFTLYVD